MSVNSFWNDVAAIPQIARGKVWCRTCGREQSVNGVGAMQNGWPKCCGYTMTIDSPTEQAKEPKP
jgi:hypothetical protein